MKRRVRLIVAGVMVVACAATAAPAYRLMFRFGEHVPHRPWGVRIANPFGLAGLLPLGPMFAVLLLCCLYAARRLSWKHSPLLVLLLPWTVWIDLATRAGMYLDRRLWHAGIRLPTVEPLLGRADVAAQMALTASALVMALLLWRLMRSRMVLVTALIAAACPIGYFWLAALLPGRAGEYAALAMPSVWMGLVGAAMWSAAWRRGRKDGGRVCSTCGYDLAGLLRGSVCPECGQPGEAMRTMDQEQEATASDAPCPTISPYARDHKRI